MKARVVFRFLYSPEYIKIGERLLFRDGRTKGIGKVVELLVDGFPDEEQVSTGVTACALNFNAVLVACFVCKGAKEIKKEGATIKSCKIQQQAYQNEQSVIYSTTIY